jgi:ABC-type sugar transport system ATPase subunit
MRILCMRLSNVNDDVIQTRTFTFLLTCIVVGCLERKGISGGQRRRVSVAIEMMKEADMFLLDGMLLRMCDNRRWPLCSQIISV